MKFIVNQLVERVSKRLWARSGELCVYDALDSETSVSYIARAPRHSRHSRAGRAGPAGPPPGRRAGRPRRRPSSDVARPGPGGPGSHRPNGPIWSVAACAGTSRETVISL